MATGKIRVAFWKGKARYTAQLHFGGGGSASGGTVYQLAPPAAPGGAWSETILHSFNGGEDGYEPADGVMLGPNGELYGTTVLGGHASNGVNGGTAFEVTP